VLTTTIKNGNFIRKVIYTMNEKQKIHVKPRKPGEQPELHDNPTIISDELLQKEDTILKFDDCSNCSILVVQGCETENFRLEFVIKNGTKNVRFPLDKKFNTETDTEREICVPLNVLRESFNEGNGNLWIVAAVEQYLNFTHKPVVKLEIIEIYTDLDDSIPEVLITVRVGKFRTTATTDLSVLHLFLDDESQLVLMEIHPEIEEWALSHMYMPKGRIQAALV
jgi:hypothetical protein